MQGEENAHVFFHDVRIGWIVFDAAKVVRPVAFASLSADILRRSPRPKPRPTVGTESLGVFASSAGSANHLRTAPRNSHSSSSTGIWNKSATIRIIPPSSWHEVNLMIRKLQSGEYRLYSRKVDPKTGKRRNLGTFKSRAAAEKHERDVQYFKRH
ncbi:MAG: hypothetical protein P4M05_06905 [Bradyrhizobium sp.]|nr:hypothetical protein [Bradyrhizobium sp.]